MAGGRWVDDTVVRGHHQSRAMVEDDVLYQRGRRWGHSLKMLLMRKTSVYLQISMEGKEGRGRD